MIDKMSAIHGRSIGAGQNDPVRWPERPDAAQISSTHEGSRLTSAIDHMVQQGMPIDDARIHSIRQAIADGHYPVDPMIIAEKMIDFERSAGDFS